MDATTALLVSMRDRLRSKLLYLPEECDLRLDGTPPPMAGERFIAVCPAKYTNTAVNGFIEEFGCNVVVSLRGRYVPMDRWGKVFFEKASSAIAKYVQDISTLLHRKYDLMNLTNELLPATENGFIEPLLFKGSDSIPKIVRGDWFSADGGENLVGLTSTLYFAGATRIRIQPTTG